MDTPCPEPKRCGEPFTIVKVTDSLADKSGLVVCETCGHKYVRPYDESWPAAQKYGYDKLKDVWW